MEIILASSSKYRSQLLVNSGIIFESIAPNLNESALPNETPTALVRRLSEAKAETLSSQFSKHLIIGSDQVLDFEGEILGKPGSFESAKEQLDKLNGQTVLFHTGLCLLNSDTGKRQLTVTETQVTYRNTTPGERLAYLRADQPFDCAGSFKSEGLGINILSRIEGPDPNALVGLPIIELLKMLRNEGVNPLTMDSPANT